MITCTCWQVATKRRGWNFCRICEQHYRTDELTDFLPPAAERSGNPDINREHQQQHTFSSTKISGQVAGLARK